MATKLIKIYAVQRGLQVGLFHDWDVTETHVKGFRGAKHQSFLPAAFAEAYEFAYGTPWAGTGPPGFVLHPDGRLELVDPDAGRGAAPVAAAPRPVGGPDRVVVRYRGSEIERALDPVLAAYLDAAGLLP